MKAQGCARTRQAKNHGWLQQHGHSAAARSEMQCHPHNRESHWKATSSQNSLALSENALRRQGCQHMLRRRDLRHKQEFYDAPFSRVPLARAVIHGRCPTEHVATHILSLSVWQRDCPPESLSKLLSAAGPAIVACRFHCASATTFY